MKKTRKRGLAWLMTLAMVVSLLPMVAWADPLPPGSGGNDEEPLFYMRVGVYEDADLQNEIYDHEYSDVEEPVYAQYLPIELDADEYREELGTIEHDGVTYEIAGFTRDYENIVTSLYIPAPSGEDDEDWWRTWSDGIQLIYLPKGASIGGGSRDKTDYSDVSFTIEVQDKEGNPLGYKPLGEVKILDGKGNVLDSASGMRGDRVARVANVKEGTKLTYAYEFYDGRHDYAFKGIYMIDSGGDFEEISADRSQEGYSSYMPVRGDLDTDMVVVFEHLPRQFESDRIREGDNSRELKVTNNFVIVPDGEYDQLVLIDNADYHVTMHDGVEAAKKEVLYVYDGVDANITLENVNVDTVAGIVADESVDLILKGENVLKGDRAIMQSYNEEGGDVEVRITLDEATEGSLTLIGSRSAAKEDIMAKLMHDDIIVWTGADKHSVRVLTSGANKEFKMDDAQYVHIAANPADERYEYFDFNNDADKFFNFGEVQNYSSGKLFDWFEKRMEENGISSGGKLYALMRAAAEEWGGSCFGFSAVAAMFHTEEMSLNELRLFDKNALDLPTTTDPKDDTDVRDLLHYYQTLQMLPEVRGIMRYLSNADDREYLLDLAERLARATDAGTEEPVMFLYFMGNGAGHAVILDGAVRNADGSYTVMVEDNRFYGQELATDVDYRNGGIYGYKLTGQDINPTLEISRDGKKAVMTFEGGWTTRDEESFSKYPAFKETLTRYEVITNYEMLKDYFPGEYVAPVIDKKPADGGVTVIDKPIFWFETWDTVIVDPGDGEEEPELPLFEVVVDPGQGDGKDLIWSWELDTRKENLIAGATVSVDENMNVVMEYAPATVMAQVEASDQYAAVNPDGEIAGKVAYAEGDIYSSIDTAKADAAVFDPAGAVGLAGNEGEFEITVTRNGGEELAQISGDAMGEISVVPTEDGITAIIPAGTYQVTFIDKDGKETEKSFTTKGGLASIGTDGAVVVPEVVPVSELPFTDVKANDWFYNAVKYVYENGLMSGTSETTFSPAVTTSRGMITSILWRMEGRPDAAAEVPFKDVAKDAYYAEAIAWAAENGIVSGYDADTFGPNDPITREQLASILFRYAKFKGYDVSVGENTNILSYNDAFEISEYAIPAMQWACGAGIISGNTDGTLNPAGQAQRSHAAQMLMKFEMNVK